MENEKLFCKSGGCTAKLGAGILSRVLEQLPRGPENPNLLVGYDSKDDEKAEGKAEKGKKNYVKRERYYGSYTRSFDVSAVEVDKIDAEYSDGVLKLTMPKKAALIPASRRLEIK